MRTLSLSGLVDAPVMTKKKSPAKKLRAIMLADDTLLPEGELKDFSEKQRELRKTEFDVRDAMLELGHDVVLIGVSDDLSTIRGAIDAHKPDIAFNLVVDPKGRREFLKLMSASLALAGVGACTRQPQEQIVPYVRQPEDIVPGRPLFYASAVIHAGYAQPVLVESHMGRPTKIEGNPDHPASLGAADSFTQGEILNLYDPDRAKAVTNRGEVRTWGQFLTAAQQALSAQKAQGGAGVRFLTGPITSPSVAELMSSILTDNPRARWHQFDPTGMQGVVGAANARPIYHFDKADIIVSLDADFIGGGRGACATSATSPPGGDSPTTARR